MFASITASLPALMMRSDMSLRTPLDDLLDAGGMDAAVGDELLRASSAAMVRRIGSKQETAITPGVSSTRMSTPVARSRARMFRPSRPMIRPFMSSAGIRTLRTTASATCSAANR